MKWIKKLFNKRREENKRFNNLSFEKRMEYYMKFKIKDLNFNFTSYIILGLIQIINYLLLFITEVKYISTIISLNIIFSKTIIIIALVDLLTNAIYQFHKSYKINK